MILQCQRQTEPKDQIVALLGEQFPLTAHKLYNLMKKRYLTGTTYHATYKHLQEMVRKGVVTKSGMEYRLNEEWIKKSREFAVQTEINYGSGILNGIMEKVEIGMIVPFTSLSNFYSFLNTFKRNFVNCVDTSKDNSIYYLGDHLLGPIVSMKDRVDVINEIKKKNIKYVVCIRGNTPLDKRMIKFYRKLGIKYSKYGMNDGGNGMLTVYNNMVLYSIRPPKLLKEIDALFNNAKNTNDIITNEKIVSLLNKECKFYAVIINDKKVADYYRSMIDSIIGNTKSRG